MSDPAVLRHVIDAIAPASAAHAEGARQRIAAAGTPVLERLARSLAGAQHTAKPRTERRMIVVVAGDHGVGDPGIVLGDAHPTIIAAQAIADGAAALAQVARASRAPVVLVDAGVVERSFMPATSIALSGRPSANLRDGDAMTIVDAAIGLETGIALAISLSEPGLDLIAVGAIGVGADAASEALLAAATTASGLELLVSCGGPDTAVLAGLMLAAASMNIPIVLDGYATGAAALVAARLAPNVVGYLVAAHTGTDPQPRILERLGLTPVFDVGLGYGEGTGAAMLLPLLDQVAALAA